MLMMKTMLMMMTMLIMMIGDDDECHFYHDYELFHLIMIYLISIFDDLKRRNGDDERKLPRRRSLGGGETRFVIFFVSSVFPLFISCNVSFVFG